MRGIGEDPETQRWWKVTDGMQESFVEGATGSGGTIPWWQVCVLDYDVLELLTMSPSRNWKRCSVLKGRRLDIVQGIKDISSKYTKKGAIK